MHTWVSTIRSLGIGLCADTAYQGRSAPESWSLRFPETLHFKRSDRDVRSVVQ